MNWFKKSPLSYRYTCACLTYGFTRKFVNTHGGTIMTYDDDYKKVHVPMLHGQKACAIFCGGVISSIYMPLYVINDLCQIEMYVTKKDPKLYGFHQAGDLFGHIMS